MQCCVHLQLASKPVQEFKFNESTRNLHDTISMHGTLLFGHTFSQWHTIYSVQMMYERYFAIFLCIQWIVTNVLESIREQFFSDHANCWQGARMLKTRVVIYAITISFANCSCILNFRLLSEKVFRTLFDRNVSPSSPCIITCLIWKNRWTFAGLVRCHTLSVCSQGNRKSKRDWNVDSFSVIIQINVVPVCVMPIWDKKFWLV